MGKTGTGISEYRDVTAYLTTAGSVGAAGLPPPIDSIKAITKYVSDNEARYNDLGAAGVPDLAAQNIIVTGNLPFQVHVFTVTTTMATGVYLLVYVETVPTPADVT
jgi:hypothetical protein